jgi:hypothetical protein
LETTDNALNNQVLASIPYFLATIEDDTARGIVRGVGKVLERTPIEEIAVKAVGVLEIAIVRIGSQAIADIAAPIILQVWRREHWPLLAAGTINLLYNLNVQVDVAMSRIVVLAADILSYPGLQPFAQARLIALIAKIVGLLQTDHKISPQLMEQARAYETPPSQYPEKPYEPRAADPELSIEVSESEEDEEAAVENVEETPTIAEPPTTPTVAFPAPSQAPRISGPAARARSISTPTLPVYSESPAEAAAEPTPDQMPPRMHRGRKLGARTDSRGDIALPPRQLRATASSSEVPQPTASPESPRHRAPQPAKISANPSKGFAADDFEFD